MSSSMQAISESPRACCCAYRGRPASPPVLTPLLDDMVRIPAGSFTMGSEKFYREERPLRAAHVESFWMDVHPVTNAQYARFVSATGYLTVAERAPDPALYPDADPALLVPGSLVFAKPQARVSLRDYRAWWAYVPGASWRQPTGPASSIAALSDHPVVHVCSEDALAYASWAGKSLPSEAEWEFAARGGLEAASYPWGDDFAPDGELRANIWLGQFPWQSLKPEGSERTTPVAAFPPNGYGLYDVVGNVWEWTTSVFEDNVAACCGGASAPRAAARRVVKGGSHLCAPNYCLRYRPSARQGQTPDTATSHIGFRCIVRAA